MEGEDTSRNHLVLHFFFLFLIILCTHLSNVLLLLLGTHGHMKCVFDGQLKSQDCVMLHLYKRVFPKWTYDPCVSAPEPLFKSALSPIQEEDEEMA